MDASDREDDEDSIVDFTNASLYLGGFQTAFAIVCCAAVSVLACWLAPDASAVRTLALCVATGGVLMRKPLRVGRAHGVKIIFSALQPAVAIYILALVVEQLVHTCTRGSRACRRRTPGNAFESVQNKPWFECVVRRVRLLSSARPVEVPRFPRLYEIVM